MNYQKIYNQIIERAQNRKLDGYKERHHIIPKCLGGDNDKLNLIDLTAREHFLCHKLLCEIYPKNDKLLYALFLMTIGKQKTKDKHYIINSRLYERLKKEFSQMLTGKKHSEETKQKISKSNKGKKYSEEAKKNMSEGRKGHKMYNDEWKLKIKEALTGIKRSDEFKQKQSKARKNKPSKSKKPVLQYDKQGNFLKEYPSAIEAAKSLNKKTGSAITEVCNGKGNRKSIFGYIWKYKN
jgi:hypothetical protein